MYVKFKRSMIVTIVLQILNTNIFEMSTNANTIIFVHWFLVVNEYWNFFNIWLISLNIQIFLEYIFHRDIISLSLDYYLPKAGINKVSKNGKGSICMIIWILKFEYCAAICSNIQIYLLENILIFIFEYRVFLENI